LEITRIPFDVFNIAKRFQFNIQVPADLDQFRRDNSHGTIVCGKGFIKLGHQPTDGG
jgi:hypothetical protein